MKRFESELKYWGLDTEKKIKTDHQIIKNKPDESHTNISKWGLDKKKKINED